MKSALKIMAIVVGVLAGTFVGGGYLLPSKVQMTAWQTVIAPHDHMSALVATPSSWDRWSVFRELESYATRLSIAGPKTGTGASWLLAGETWSARALITAFEPAARVNYAIEVDRLKVPITAQVDFYNRGRTTKVGWKITADVGKNLPLRWLGLVGKWLLKPSYQGAIKQLGVIAAERAHQETQDALAAEEAALIGKKPKGD